LLYGENFLILEGIPLTRSLLRPLAILGFVVSMAGVTPASAAIMYTFTGTCSDCTGTATATLFLVDTYVPGTNTMNTADVISFTYNGTDLFGPYTIDQSNITFINATMPTASGFADFFIGSQSCASCQGIQFQSFLSDGTWSTGLNGTSTDMGTQGVWGAPVATPEPSAFLLIGAGLGGVALLKRRRAVRR
jgi:hypothetical protein